MSVTLDQLPQAILDAETATAQLEQSVKIIQSLQDGPQKVFIEAVNDWFELDKAQIVSLYQARLDASVASLQKLKDLQKLLNQALEDALNGK